MTKVIDIFNGKMPSVVGNIVYKPHKASKQFEFKDDFEPASFYNYYNDFEDISDELSLEGLGENPIINQTEEEPLYVETSHKIDTPILTYSRKLLSGNHQFKTQEIDVGNLQEFLDILANNNIYVRITSGFRKDAVTSNNNTSNHATGNAIDITPIEGETWEELINKMKNSPEVRRFMREHKMRILDERSPEMLAKTGGTGAHLHISYGKTEGKNSDEFFA